MFYWTPSFAHRKYPSHAIFPRQKHYIIHCMIALLISRRPVMDYRYEQTGLSAFALARGMSRQALAH